MNPMWRAMLALSGCLSLGVAAADAVTAFVNVNVIPMSSETVLEQQTVIVADGKILVIGDVDDIPVPEGTTLIDGTDRFLMPGLAEMHAHVTGTDPQQIDRLATLFVANGVTRIRGMLGRASHLRLRAQLESGEVFGPRLVTSGPSFNGRSVSGAAQAAQMVKVHPGLSHAEFNRLAATANEIGMPFAGHVPVASGVAEALRNSMTTIDHLDGYFLALLPSDHGVSGGIAGFFDVMLADDIDARGIPRLAADTAAAGTWNVPTEVLIEQIIDATPAAELRLRPEMRYVSRSQLERWVEAKLRTGTVAVAEFLGANTGIVAAGRDADLILLDANPLVDISNSDRIHGVMLRGRWLSSRELAARLKKYEVAH